MRPQFDQAELADLREGAVAARPGRRAAEGGGIGGRVGHIEDDAIDAHQAESPVETAGGIGPGQRANDLLEQVSHRGDAQALPSHTQAGPMRGHLADAESPRVLEDLADRQLGQQPHGQDHPANDFVRQCAASRIRLAGDLKGLANGLGRDNLFESRQTIQDPARVVGRERAMSLWHASRSLLVAGVVNKPKLTGGCDLRLFQRYCP